MDEDEFVEIMQKMGYTIKEPLNLKMIGAETGYEFSLQPLDQEKFNWVKCNDDFLNNIKNAANIPLSQMDFTAIKRMESNCPFIEILTTGLPKVVIAIKLVNQRLLYNFL